MALKRKKPGLLVSALSVNPWVAFYFATGVEVGRPRLKAVTARLWHWGSGSAAPHSRPLQFKLRVLPSLSQARRAGPRRTGIMARGLVRGCLQTTPLDAERPTSYPEFVIRSFQDREVEFLFHRERSRTLPLSIQRVALRKLRMLHRSQSLQDLRVPPANRLEKLSGDRAGQYSIRINDQWRICFVWQNGDAWNVEIVDYH